MTACIGFQADALHVQGASGGRGGAQGGRGAGRGDRYTVPPCCYQ